MPPSGFDMSRRHGMVGAMYDAEEITRQRGRLKAAAYCAAAAGAPLDDLYADVLAAVNELEASRLAAGMTPGTAAAPTQRPASEPTGEQLVGDDAFGGFRAAPGADVA